MKLPEMFLPKRERHFVSMPLAIPPGFPSHTDLMGCSCNVGAEKGMPPILILWDDLAM
jgi:hypothetical protein